MNCYGVATRSGHRPDDNQHFDVGRVSSHDDLTVPECIGNRLCQRQAPAPATICVVR